MTRFDRIDTPVEHERAQRELVRLAYVERRAPHDPERAALQDAIADYAVRSSREGRPS